MLADISEGAHVVTDFLSEIAETSGNKLVDTILRFCLPVDFSACQPLRDELFEMNDVSYLLEHQRGGIFMLGFGEAYTISAEGKQRFEILEQQLADRPEIVDYNPDGVKGIPLFLGGVKFTHESKCRIWGDFEDSYWFIPEALLLKRPDGCYLLFHAYVDGAINTAKIIDRFTELQHQLLSPRSPQEPVQDARVLSISGNSSDHKKRWVEEVNAVKEAIVASSISKAVLARRLDLQLTAEPRLLPLLEKLRRSYDDCNIFVFQKNGSYFFGASPETLIKLENNTLYTEALAGTVPRGDSEEEEAYYEKLLLDSAKDRHEHQVVVDFIKDTLAEFTENGGLEESPGIKKLRFVQHLQTKMKGKLKKDTPLFLMLEKIFPTPAVCGVPKEEAYKIIRRQEKINRGLYAGMTGWFNTEGDAKFIVGIRSALLRGSMLYAYAGCGIVDKSDPEKEFTETELKFKAITSLFSDEN